MGNNFSSLTLTTLKSAKNNLFWETLYRNLPPLFYFEWFCDQFVLFVFVQVFVVIVNLAGIAIGYSNSAVEIGTYHQRKEGIQSDLGWGEEKDNN